MSDISIQAPRASRWFAPAIFCVTIFLSASLLFFVQPLFTKIVLPHIGGAPAVWTTAMLFFQTVLIGGYFYAHIITRYTSVRTQMIVHLGLWALALFFLPLAVAEGWKYDAEQSSALQTLLIFAGGVGLPFAVLSANAPLIQSWYAKSGGFSSDDPYFLYGASNLGSLIALLAFPLIAEPIFGAAQIGWGWMVGFWALGACLLSAGLCVTQKSDVKEGVLLLSNAPTLKTRAYWILAAFVPSSLMLSVTTKISTDIGSVPLFWVIPLALFLLTFVLVFTPKPIVSDRVLKLGFLVGIGGLAAAFSNLFGVHLTIPVAIGMLVAFFLTALFAHSLLYKARPSAEFLTSYYFTMSVGGALGGLFNSIIAPTFFNEIYEGAFTVAIAAGLLLQGHSKPRQQTLALSGLFLLLLVFRTPVAEFAGEIVTYATMACLLLLVAIGLRTAAQAQMYVVICILVAGQLFVGHGKAIFADRSFFGAHKVLEQDGLRIYANGTTWHGAQRLEDFSAKKPQPLFYYHPNAPMAQVLNSDEGHLMRSVGIVGQGVGALSCYAKPHQNWQFYEIDALVDRIARNPDYFSFMSKCGADMPTHLGDARVVLQDQHDVSFDILIIDAFSSDAVPVHLITEEAVQVYLNRLSEGGMLMFHISNRYYAIDRPLGRVAEKLGLVAKIQDYAGNSTVDPGDVATRVVAMSKTAEGLRIVQTDARWMNLPSDGGRVWTDDFANVLEILR